MKKRVLVDVDGVVADFHKPTLELIHQRYGVQYDPKTFPSWDIFSTIDPSFKPAIEAAWHQPGWCAAIPAYPGAVEGVHALMEVADVYFVTAQMEGAPHWMWERSHWLHARFGVDATRVVFTLSKHLVVGDILIDDKPSNVNGWMMHHPGKHCVVWDQPWNRMESIHTDVTRMDSWAEILNTVTRSG